MATPATNFNGYLAWMPTNNALANLLLKLVRIVAFSLRTMKPKPNVGVSKGLYFQNPARYRRNVANMRNNPGSAMPANGMLVLKVASLYSNAAMISTVVSITAKLVSSVGSAGASSPTI